jgi:hypothetical protein
MKIKLFFAIFIIWVLFIKEDVVTHGEGIVASEIPIQKKVENAQPFAFKDYTITPLRNFNIEARVLSKEKYSFDKEAELSPLDLTLGWGRMSDESILKMIDITQSGRWYHWQTDRFPIPRREIETHSANMHMIPATKEIEKSLNKIRKGEVVMIEGYLVRVDAKDGYYWVSSLSRSDTGAHACEVVFVKSIERR